jgi:hypothetical protein
MVYPGSHLGFPLPKKPPLICRLVQRVVMGWRWVDLHE